MQHLNGRDFRQYDALLSIKPDLKNGRKREPAPILRHLPGRIPQLTKRIGHPQAGYLPMHTEIHGLNRPRNREAALKNPGEPEQQTQEGLRQFPQGQNFNSKTDVRAGAQAYGKSVH